MDLLNNQTKDKFSWNGSAMYYKNDMVEKSINRANNEYKLPNSISLIQYLLCYCSFCCVNVNNVNVNMHYLMHVALYLSS